MVPVLKHQKRAKNERDLSEVPTEDEAGQDIKCTQLHVAYYISTDMDVMIDQIRNLDNILRDINISNIEYIKNYI